MLSELGEAAPAKATKGRASTSSGKAGKRGRPSKRADQVLRAVKKNPGQTVGEIAKGLKVKNATSLYPVANKLIADKQIKKKGKGLYPA